MKNLIDELHTLDEYEYKVSPDFSKKVMKEIKKNKNTNKISNVISLASFGVAACLAVVVFANSNMLGRFGAKNESADSINQSELNMAYYDSFGNYATNDSEMKIQEEVIEMDFGNLKSVFLPLIFSGIDLYSLCRRNFFRGERNV